MFYFDIGVPPSEGWSVRWAMTLVYEGILWNDSWGCFMWNISPCSLSHVWKWILFHWQMWMVFCVSLVWLWIPVTSPSRWCQFGYSCLLTDLYCCVKESIYHFVPCFWLGLNKIRNSFYVCHVCTDEIVRYLLQRPL